MNPFFVIKFIKLHHMNIYYIISNYCVKNANKYNNFAYLLPTCDQFLF